MADTERSSNGKTESHELQLPTFLSHEKSASMEVSDSQPTSKVPERYIQGTRLHMTSFAFCLCLFLVNVEIPIVNTSLEGIVADLHEFQRSSWVIAAYLVTYVGVLIIWAKFSDIFGRKLTASCAILLFIIFSGACGAAQTMIQLIILRAFQGLGGAGLYSLCMVMFFELVPPEKWPAYSALCALTYGFSQLLGPIWGGAINDNSTWRWIFLFNVPAGVVGLALILIFLPSNFPNHHQGRQYRNSQTLKEKLARIDFIGTFGLLAATVLLVTAVEEAAFGYFWGSALVVTLLVISAVIWVLFLAWERHITNKGSKSEPVFPGRFLKNRILLATLLTAFLLGPCFTAAVFSIPQRFIVVNGLSALDAGIRLIPFTFTAPLASVMASIASSNKKVPPIYLVLPAAALQIIGFALMAYEPVSTHISKAQYGYQVIAAFGAGINVNMLTLMIPLAVSAEDQSVSIGAVSQFRMMGAAVGVSIVTCVLNGYVRSGLASILEPHQLDAVLQVPRRVAGLPSSVQVATKLAFDEGYNRQMKVIMGFAIAQFASAFLMWQNPPVRL